MKDIKNKVLNFLNQQWDGTWENLEQFSLSNQGKGWGGFTNEHDTLDLYLNNWEVL